MQNGKEYACRRLPTDCRRLIAEALPCFAVTEQPAKALAKRLPGYLPASANLCRDDLHDSQSAVGTLLGSTLEPCIFQATIWVQQTMTAIVAVVSQWLNGSDRGTFIAQQAS